MSEPPRILVIAGSARVPSYTRSLSRTVARALEGRGARADVLDLQATPLPSMVPAERARRAGHGDGTVADLFKMAEGASAYVLASPTYHNSYSGVLKNALDYLTLKDMRYRPVGLMGHGGRSTQAVDHLRLVVRGLLGVAIPTQVCTADEDFAPAPGPDGDYQVRNADILGRIDRFADELVLFARHLAALRAEMDAARAG